MPRPAKVPTATILAWLRDNPGRSAADAAQFFGVPGGTIRAAMKRERDNPRDNLTLLERPAPPPPVEEPLEASDLAAKDLVRVAIARRISRLAQPIDPREESVADTAKILNTLLDRLPAIEALEAVAELDPTTDEGTKALIEALKAFPADVREVMRRALAS